MKILHIIDHIGSGGAQIILKSMFEAQQDNENIFCYALRDNQIRRNINHGNIFYNESCNKFNLSCLFRVEKIIKKNGIDTIHCHLPKSFIVGFCLKKIHFPKIKLIFHEHGYIFQHKKWFTFFLNKTQKKVDLFIAVSQSTKQKLIKNAKISENRIKVLYNFVDLKRFNPQVLNQHNRTQQREKLGVKKNDFIVGFIGRLNKIKGCEYLLKAVPHITIPNFKIVIVGEGSERKNLEELSEKLNIRDKIIFLGYTENTLKIYNTIDCLVAPSKSESFGLSVMEAQACGVPVIVSDIPALNEFIKDYKNGLLFKAENENDLAKKINLVYNNKELKEKIRENSLETVQNYSLDEYLKKLEDIYLSYSKK